MLKLLLFPVVLFALANASGEFTVLHSPESVEFEGDALERTLLPDIYSALLGLTTKRESNWDGLYITDPFDLAETAFSVNVEGVDSLEMSRGRYFGLSSVATADESEIFSDLEKRLREHDPETSGNSLRVDLSHDDTSAIYELFKNKPVARKTYKYLSPESGAEDRKFLEELSALNSISEALESGSVRKEKFPKILWLKLGSLGDLSRTYGRNSTVLLEAKQLLTETLLDIGNLLKKTFDGHALVTITTIGESVTRSKRASPTPTADDADLNLAKTYSEDYPVIFNIILWFCVVFFFSLLAISMFIADMDPGRDSIIYRMTSTRMKKDN